MAGEGSNFVQPAIPRFDRHYDHWSMLMENFLRSKEYWGLVEHGITQYAEGTALTEAQLKALEDQKLKDLKTKNYLFQAIDRAILETILAKDTSKDIWDSMKKKYQGTARVKRAQLQALRKEFEMLHMKVGDTVNDYFARVLTVANKMRIHGEKMGDVVVIEKILRSMTTKFDYVVCSIEESNEIDNLSIDELQSSLLVHEQRIIGHVMEEQVLKVSQENNSPARGRGRGGYRGRGRGRGRQGSFDKSAIECYNCHELGHFQYECPTKEQYNKANFTEAEEEMVLMSYVNMQEDTSNMLWYLDFGCSNHMSGDKKFFTTFDETFREKVKLGNNSSLCVKGRGNINIEVNGVKLCISGVFYVPELKSNLISLGQLQEKGLVILIQKNMCQIHHHEKCLIIEAEMAPNRMFSLQTKASCDDPKCFQSTTQEDASWLWHYRYGHLSFNGLKTLEQKHMVTGLPRLQAPSKICEECMIGKQHRDIFPQKSTWKSSYILQLVHSDICGPISPISNSSKRYFITFTDDFSRKTWVYFLSEKSEAITVFKKFKAMVEKEAGVYIKAFRTDRGGEFTSHKFTTFCEENGVHRQLTTSYTLQQNGVSEMKNRTIMNMVRSMLARTRVPKNFWPEAVNWSVHILNRCPTLAVKEITPEEAWSGKKPGVAHFKVFGCLAYAHVNDKLRSKLDDKSVPCVMFGISDESKAYRLYNPATNRIIVSRDVVFDEKVCWNWTNEEAEKIVANLEGNEENSVADTNSEGSGSADENSVADTNSEGLADENLEEHRIQEPRLRRPPAWMTDYVSGDELSEEENIAQLVLLPDCDPITFDDAVRSSKWRKAMDLEIEAIVKNNTWELTELPAKKKTIGVKWIYKTKLKENGEVDKYKARLVAKGYTQEYGIDYAEVFAPVARHDTIRLVVSMAAQNNWCINQLDVKSAFLHGELNEQVFVDQPPGYVKKGEEQKVYKLKRALYGLKQAPRAWYSRIESYFTKMGFKKCPYEHTLFIKHGNGGKILIVCLYVDDLIYTGNDEAMSVEFKKDMMVEFEMTDLGKMHYFLGMEVKQTTDGIFVGQKKYAQEVLDRFQMKECNPVQNPIVPGAKLTIDIEGTKVDSTYFKQMVGSLMYLTITRPDLMFVVSLISRFMESPTELHFQAAKRVLRYLKGTVDYGLFYKRSSKQSLVGFSDSDYGGDLEDRKSTSGYAFIMSSAAVAWSSKKQPVVTLSTTEAEFIAAASCACQAVWMRRILEELCYTQREATKLFCDNSSAIKLSKNPVMHGRSKHIDIRFHFLRDLTKDGVVELVHCPSQEQVADIFTKPLKLEAFLKIRNLLGVRSSSCVN